MFSPIEQPRSACGVMQRTLLLALAGWLVCCVGRAAAEPAKTEEPAEVSALIAQLGNEDYFSREAAQRELITAGEVALGALEAARSSANPEIRWRAALAVTLIRHRLQSAQFTGKWATARGEWFEFGEGRWACSGPGYDVKSGELRFVKLAGDLAHFDLVVTQGSTAGQTCQIVLRREGDTLHYCGTYGPVRPRQFADKVPGAVSYTLKRVSPADEG